MARLRLILAILLALMLSSCYETPDGVIEVNIEGWKDPAIVLVSEASSFECTQLREISKKIFSKKKNINDKRIHGSGYYFIDYKDRSTSFRAYFRPELLISIDKSTFIFCSGSGKSFENSTCAVSSIHETYCYDFIIEGENKGFKGFDVAIKAVDYAVHSKRNN